jgi:alkylated DNA repair dioxygenase AlkB
MRSRGARSTAFALPDAEVTYTPDFLEPSEAARLLEALLALPDWEQLPLFMFGRRVPAPRLSAWYGEAGYAYSGVVHAPRAWPEALGPLRQKLTAEVGCEWNGVLASLYRDGADSMGWHSDAEPELGECPVIASVSLGERRRFLLRHRRRKDVETLEVPLDAGSLLVMRGPTQHHWKHSVPKTRRPVGARVNLTFRRIVAER